MNGWTREGSENKHEHWHRRELQDSKSYRIVNCGAH